MQVIEHRHYNGMNYWYEITTGAVLGGSGIMLIEKTPDGKNIYRVSSRAYDRMGRPK